MLNNILKINWAKKVVSFFVQDTLFQNLCDYCINDLRLFRLMVRCFSMDPREGCNCTKKRLINASKSLILKVGRGFEWVNVDDLRVILIDIEQ